MYNPALKLGQPGYITDLYKGRPSKVKCHKCKGSKVNLFTYGEVSLTYSGKGIYSTNCSHCCATGLEPIPFTELIDGHRGIGIEQ